MMTSLVSEHDLPSGVVVHALVPHRDERGCLTEIYREAWSLGCRPVQLNAVTSDAGVLRGVHVHVRHIDHLVVVAGRMLVGLHDLRPWSPTAGAARLIEINAAVPRAVVIPCGVAHGFYFFESSMLVYGVSHYWDPADEIACRWDCPELGIAWPTTAPTLSEGDAAAGDYPAFVETFRRSWTAVHETSERASR